MTLLLIHGVSPEFAKKFSIKAQYAILLNLMDVSSKLLAIARNAGLEEAQAGIKIAGRNINNHRYADDTNLMAESEEELEKLLIKVK